MIVYISKPKLIYILHFDARRNVIHILKSPKSL